MAPPPTGSCYWYYIGTVQDADLHVNTMVSRYINKSIRDLPEMGWDGIVSTNTFVDPDQHMLNTEHELK